MVLFIRLMAGHRRSISYWLVRTYEADGIIARDSRGPAGSFENPGLSAARTEFAVVRDKTRQACLDEMRAARLMGMTRWVFRCQSYGCRSYRSSRSPIRSAMSHWRLYLYASSMSSMSRIPADSTDRRHRDLGSQERDGTEAQELKILNKSQTGLRWHLALVDDACLQIVPGSHKRYRTEHERSCLLETRNEDIPGQYTIQLSAGEAVFWNGNSIHRGIYKRDYERLTISASWSKFIQGLSPSKVDSRLEWRLNSDVRANLPLELHQYYDRWYELQLPNS